MNEKCEEQFHLEIAISTGICYVWCTVWVKKKFQCDTRIISSVTLECQCDTRIISSVTLEFQCGTKINSSATLEY